VLVAKSYYQIGLVREDTDRLEEAVKAFTRCIELDSKHAWAFAHRGVVLLRMGKKAEAAKDFEMFLNIRGDLKAQLDQMVKEAKEKPPRKIG
jgi:tetratricopeptide (TPR) repeat protein